MRHIKPFLETFESTAHLFKPGRQITVVEIGVARAHSTAAFMKGLISRDDGSRLYSIDTEPCMPNIDRRCRQQDIDRSKVNFEFLQRDSQNTPWEFGSIDILFIDGEHTYDGVRSDYERYAPHMNGDGVILIHDVLVQRYTVKDFWEELRGDNGLITHEHVSGGASLGEVLKK